MSSVEIVLSALSAAAGAAGTWFWLREHTHPELVSRAELALLQVQLSEILAELRYLRNRLDSRP